MRWWLSALGNVQHIVVGLAVSAGLRAAGCRTLGSCVRPGVAPSPPDPPVSHVQAAVAQRHRAPGLMDQGQCRTLAAELYHNLPQGAFKVERRLVIVGDWRTSISADVLVLRE